MWIKVCGIRDVATAEAIAAAAPAARPDAIGLNFFAGSRRQVERDVAGEIVAVLSGADDVIEPVGLFVNSPLQEVVATAEALGLDWLQLHGDEPPEFLAALKQERPGVSLIRAVRIGEDGLGELADYFDRCAELDAVPDACLLDARVPGEYGGTGQQPPWDLLAAEYDRGRWPPMVLAGGLSPGNVTRAIHDVSPWGVDVAGGVESAPGVKDLEKVEQFVSLARGEDA